MLTFGTNDVDPYCCSWKVETWHYPFYKIQKARQRLGEGPFSSPVVASALLSRRATRSIWIDISIAGYHPQNVAIVTPTSFPFLRQK